MIQGLQNIFQNGKAVWVAEYRSSGVTIVFSRLSIVSPTRRMVTAAELAPLA